MTVVAGATASIDTDGAAGNQVENVTVKGNGAATVVTFSDGAATTYTAAGDQAVTIAGDAARFTGKTVTDSLTAGDTTLRITSLTGGLDARKVAADNIDLRADASGVTITTAANGQKFQITNAQTNTGTFTAAAATAAANDVTVTVDNTASGVTSVSINRLDFTNYGTVNLVANDAIAGGTVTLDTAATLNISGGATVTLAAQGGVAAHVNASGLTKALTTTSDSNWKKITGGSGNDVINITTGGIVHVLDGGAGNDTLATDGSISLNTTGASFANFEVIKLNSVAATNTAQTLTVGSGLVSGTSMSVITGNGTTADTLAVVAKSATVDLSQLSIGAGVGVTLDTSAYTSTDLTLKGTTDIAMTLTGQGGADTITGGDAADTINAGAGNDSIDGGKNNDTIDGGAGNDVIVGGLGNDSITGGTGADTMTGGAGTDTFVQTVGAAQANGTNGTHTLTLGYAGAATGATGSGTMGVAIGGTYVSVATTSAQTKVSIASALKDAINAANISGVTAAVGATAGTNDHIITLTFNAVTLGAAPAVVVTDSDTDATIAGAAGTTLVAGSAAVTSTSTTTAYDTINDYVSGDVIDFTGALALVGTANVSGTTTMASYSYTTGVATLTTVTDTSTLAKAVTAVEAAINAAGTAAAGQVAVFNYGSDAYLLVSDGVDGVGTNDALVKLAGIQVTATGLTISGGGDITAIA